MINIIKKLFKSNKVDIFNESSKPLIKDKEIDNIFTKIYIIDRNIEKSNSCRRCKTIFSNNYDNIKISHININNEDIVEVECLKCNFIHYFRNW